MLRDITIGQHFPGNSVVHRLDPRMKIILTIIGVTALFLVQNPIGFLLPLAVIIFSVEVSKVPRKIVIRSVKPILPLILFTSVLNMFFVDGTSIVKFWVVNITYEGVWFAIFTTIRIVLLIILTSMLTFTTSPIDLTDAIERLLKPLKYIRFPVHEVAMMMTIALRFIPTLIEETNKIIAAQKARGADFESGNMLNRAKAMVPILIPLFISAFRRAEELATAMECRCYHGGENRTRMKQLKLEFRDFAALGTFILITAAILLLNLFDPVTVILQAVK